MHALNFKKENAVNIHYIFMTSYIKSMVIYKNKNIINKNNNKNIPSFVQKLKYES